MYLIPKASRASENRLMLHVQIKDLEHKELKN